MSAEKFAYLTLQDQCVDENGSISIPIDPIEIAEKLGIKVTEGNLPPEVSGVISREDAKSAPVILVNRKDHENRQRFTIAHEIGHYKKHTERDKDALLGFVDYRDQTSSRGTDSEEIWANKYAAALLMPANPVKCLWAEEKSTSEMSELFGVSKQAMIIRLAQLGLL